MKSCKIVLNDTFSPVSSMIKQLGCQCKVTIMYNTIMLYLWTILEYNTNHILGATHIFKLHQLSAEIYAYHA